MTLKKQISVVLLLCMLFTVLPSGAFAQEEGELPFEELLMEELPQEEAVQEPVAPAEPDAQEEASAPTEEILPEQLQEEAFTALAEADGEEELLRAAAYIDDMVFPTLQEAVNAAGGAEATIGLIDFVGEEITIGKDQRITLNLNGAVFSGRLINFGTLTVVGEGVFEGALATKGYQVKNEQGETVDFASGETIVDAPGASFQAVFTAEQDTGARLDGDRKLPVLNLRSGSFFASSFAAGYGYEDENGLPQLIPDDAAGTISATGGVYSSIPDAYVAPGFETVWYDWGLAVAPKQVEEIQELPVMEELLPEESVLLPEEESVLLPEDELVIEELEAYTETPEETPAPTVTLTLDALSTSSSVGQVRYKGEPIARGGSVAVKKGEDVLLEFVAVTEGQILSRLAIDGAEVTPVPTTEYTIKAIEKDTTVLAEFRQAAEATVIFRNNGKDEKTFHVYEGTAIEIPQPGEVPAGQFFAGWVNEADEKDIIQPKDELTVSKSTVYNAKFTEVILHTVTYQANGGTCAIEKETVEDGGKVTLPAALRAGFRFKGWLCEKDGILYQPGMEFTPSEDVLFSAQWLEEYTVTYVLDGGMLPVGILNPTVFTAESEAITYPVPTRYQHNFMGWYLSADYSGDPVASQPQGTTGNRVLYARWEKIPEIYRIYVYHNTFGRVSVGGYLVYSGEYVEVEEGTSVTLYFDPIDNRYYVYNCTLNGDKQGSISALTIENITSNQTVVVSFMPTIARPMTGDNSNLPLWIGLLAVSGAALAAVLIIRKKKK